MSDPRSTQAPAFSAAHAQTYLKSVRRQVPGLDGLHRMAAQLLAERVPDDGHVLVLAAGGGLEINALAATHAGWRFDGVDPSADMLALAQGTTAAYRERVSLIHGVIQDAPEVQYDGAVCLLTFHFIPQAERAETLNQIRRRLKPGAPFFLAHISFPRSPDEDELWLGRHLAPGGANAATAESAKKAMLERLTILSPEQDEQMLQEAGFSEVTLVFAAMSFRGWICYG